MALQLCAVPGHSQTARPAPAELARQILQATGVQGGLVVHVGCADGKLTAALGAGDAYLVHGLDSTAENVRAAREHVHALGLYGKVSIAQLRGKRLPYASGLVNLLVSEDLGNVPAAEVMRVLCPNGVAYVKRNDVWAKTVKPRPETIDDWTHALHDASNNAVAHDLDVGPPRHLQWLCGPAWARSHDHLASVSAVVSSAARVFYIVDEGPIAAVALPAKWFLVARDAFSGVLLWKKPVGPWEGHLRGFRSGPPELSRTLVAAADRIYVTLGYEKPVCALDAATGKLLKTYAGTEDTLEILHLDGMLYLVGGRRTPQELDTNAAAWRRGVTPRARSKRVLAVDTRTGQVAWQKSDPTVAEIMPMTLAVAGGRVFCQNPDAVLCLEGKSGKELWRAPRRVSVKRRGWSTPTLVVYGDVVLSADRAVEGRSDDEDAEARKVEWEPNSAGGNAPTGELIAFSAETGKRLWSSKCQECYNAPVDVLVADGLVWTGELVRATQPGITAGRDPNTGEIKRTRPEDKTFFTVGMNHHRCHRNRATERHLVLGRAGVEFIDVKSGVGVADHWVRGACQYGVLPCNGLLYAPPHPCACYIEAKLNGFLALAPARPSAPAAAPPQQAENAARLETGPAYGSSRTPNPEGATPGADWPTYRHDAARSGSTTTQVGVKLDPAWEAGLEGRLSALVLADGMILVAQIDAHTVHALNAENGARLWSYTAGGRVDSPPTVHRGLALFGCADGWVYCLQASTGKLAWRFRAAPEDRRIVAYGQLESAWPVHGSVLVQDGAAYCVAGRSSFIDGGMVLYRLDPETGQVLAETRIDDRDPETGLEPQSIIRGTHMSGALPDVLSSDGTSLYMRHLRFDRDGAAQEPNVPHLYSPAGFLDGAWWHRTYWMLGSSMSSGYGGWPRSGTRVPAGRLLVLDDTTVYGFGRDLYAPYGGHVGLDAATVFHYGRKNLSRPRWIHCHVFAARRASARAAAARRRRATVCVGVEKSPSLNPVGKPLTVEAWVKAQKPDGAIVARGAYTHGYALYLKQGKPRFAIRVSKKLSEVQAEDEVVGKWTHLAGVLSTENKLHIYINGKLSGTADAAGLIATDPGELMEIGADDRNNVGDYKSPYPFTGAIDEVRVYHRALTPAEVQQHCRGTEGAAEDGSLVLYYSFDKGDAADQSGNENHGVLEGAKAAEGKRGTALSFSGGRRGEGPFEGRYEWALKAPMVVRAMVLTGSASPPANGTPGKTLFVAGTGEYDALELEDETTGRVRPEVLAPFSALEEGDGAVLWAIAPADGRKLVEYRLGSLPVFDGMIAANGQLYLALTSGRIICLRGQDSTP